MVHSRRANLASSGLLALMVFMGLFNSSVQQYWRNDNKAKTWSNSFGGSAGSVSGNSNSGSASYGGSRFESLGPQSIFSASNWNPPAAPPPPPPPPPAAAPAYPSNSNGFGSGASSYDRGSSNSYVPNYNSPSSSGSNSYGYPAPPPPPPPSNPYPSGSSSGSSSYGSSGSGSSYGSSGSGSSYGSSGSSGSSYGSSGSSYGCSGGNCGSSSGGSYPSYPSNHGNGYAPLPPLPPPPPSYPVNHYNNNFGTGPIQSILPLQPMSLSEIPTSDENLISGISFDCQARTTGHWRDSRYCDVFHACVYGQLKKTYSCPFVGERSYYDENLKRCEFISKNPSGCHGSSYYH